MLASKNIINLKTVRQFSIAVAAICSCWPTDSHAYLDPGTGSLMLQAIVAGIFAGLFAVKRYIFMIIGFLKSPFKKRGSTSQDSISNDRES
jgi:hypothetical protein